jgi:hypothetical protein
MVLNITYHISKLCFNKFLINVASSLKKYELWEYYKEI